MDSQSMIQLAQRILHAPNNDARVSELVHLAPDAALARIGLAHRSSFLGTALSLTGALVVGVAIGAGAALLFAPTSGNELQAKLRRQAKRLSREAKKAAGRVEAVVSSESTPSTSLDGASNHDGVHHA